MVFLLQSRAIMAERMRAGSGAIAIHVRLYDDAERLRKKHDKLVSTANVCFVKRSV